MTTLEEGSSSLTLLIYLDVDDHEKSTMEWIRIVKEKT